MKINQIINIGNWEQRNIQVGYGKRDKIVMKQTKMGKVYFMAKTFDKDIGELRSEVCATNLGRLFSFPVQRAWLCRIPQYEQVHLKPYGVIIQIDVRRQSYAKRNQFRENLVHGAALISSVDPNFSKVKDEQGRRNLYTLTIVIKALRNYVANHPNADQLWEQFFELLCFDALIGGTDRHYNNWGLLEKADDSSFLRLAPAFDNGVSLLWNLERYKPTLLNQELQRNFCLKAPSMFKKVEGGKFTLYEVLKELRSLKELKNSHIVKSVLERLNGITDGAIKSCLSKNIPRNKDFQTAGDELKFVYKYVTIRKQLLVEELERLL